MPIALVEFRRQLEFPSTMRKFTCVTGVGALALAITMVALTPMSEHGVARPLSAVKFEQDQDVKCLTFSLEDGDPQTGPSTHILRAQPKCVVPWHYHTAIEQLFVIRGSVLTEMDGMTPTNLGPGGFAMMPSKGHHQFSCSSSDECLMFVSFDRPYDIFWVKETP